MRKILLVVLSLWFTSMVTAEELTCSDAETLSACRQKIVNGQEEAEEKEEEPSPQQLEAIRILGDMVELLG